MNQICISGRLTAPPSFNEYENGIKRCVFFIANDVFRGENKSTGFYKVTAFGKLAELARDHFASGREVFVTGRLEQYRYLDENGKQVYDNSIVMDSFDFGTRPVQKAG